MSGDCHNTVISPLWGASQVSANSLVQQAADGAATFRGMVQSKLDCMHVRVLFFGVLKDLLAADGETLLLPEGATVALLLEQFHLRAAHPVWGALAVAVNREYATGTVALRDGDEVALLPPVSGGSDAAAAHVALTRERIDTAALVAALSQPGDGAIVVFDGIVRDNTRGRKTLYLDYVHMRRWRWRRCAGWRSRPRSSMRWTASGWCIGWGGWRLARAAS